MFRSHRHLLAALALCACVAEPQLSDPQIDGDDPYESTGITALRTEGRWTLPSDVKSAGDAQHVSYHGAGAWNGGRNCSGSFTAGARELGDYLQANFPQVTGVSGYACRRIVGGSGLSVHGTGRAIDVFVPARSSSRGSEDGDNPKGDPIAHWLIRNAEAIGVQLIIWDRSKWNGSRTGEKFAVYSGSHPHHDHLHVELNRDGGARRTSWFTSRGSTTPPSTTPTTPTSPTGVGDACTDGSRSGSCIDTRSSSCTGTLSAGLCSGGAEVQCCLAVAGTPSPPSTPPSPPTTPEGVGDACASGSRSGTCIDTTATSCSGTLESGLCAGPSQVRCCLAPSAPTPPSTPTGVGASCSSGSRSGTCIDTTATSCSGTLQSGLCPGPSQVRCCLSGGSSSGGSSDCARMGGACADRNFNVCSTSWRSGLCPGGVENVCCMGTLSSPGT